MIANLTLISAIDSLCFKLESGKVNYNWFDSENCVVGLLLKEIIGLEEFNKTFQGYEIGSWTRTNYDLARKIKLYKHLFDNGIEEDDIYLLEYGYLRDTKNNLTGFQYDEYKQNPIVVKDYLSTISENLKLQLQN